MSLLIHGNPYFDKSGNRIVFSLRIDDEVYKIIKIVSQKEGRSINAQLERFIEDSLVSYLEKHQD